MTSTLKLLGAVIAGTLALGCNISSSPVIARVESIQITPNRISLVPLQAADLHVMVITSRGVDSSGAAAVLQWSATGGTIANGGIFAGAYHITYTSPQQAGTYQFTVTTSTGSPTASANIAVTVTPPPIATVAVTPGSVSLALNDTTRFHATLTAEDGGVTFGRQITWSSSDSTVVMVFPEGFVRATAVGTATITATCEGHSGSATLTVHQ
jgi:hypothetical protein